MQTARIRLRGITLLTLLSLQGEVLADEKEKSDARSGLTFGLSVGGGMQTMSCDACDALGSMAVDIRIGWMLTPRLALLYGGTGFAANPEGFNSHVSFVLHGGVQYWLRPRIWAKAGLGVAELDVNEGVFGQQERSDKGLGAVAAAGYEITSVGPFQLEVECRATAGFYDEETVIGLGGLVGLSWY
jgi:hypothetical protein